MLLITLSVSACAQTMTLVPIAANFSRLRAMSAAPRVGRNTPTSYLQHVCRQLST
ncbi:hypothetical protein MBAV_005774 [Candidatus Magnetobacterium bavaricum]|uniref:Uncharacterized protein n=1 Tax=Candidatus Magnetobacterium bavaricum TaxID=29290 RepID=A0A0F3GMX0_9BACT|nr:hypothetical protein MBAV_005774 [Candidatus Magnetobacterium bavaricum]